MSKEEREEKNVTEVKNIQKNQKVDFKDDSRMFEEKKKRYERIIKEKYIDQIRSLAAIALMFLFMTGCANHQPPIVDDVIVGMTVKEEIATMTQMAVPHEYLEKQEQEEKERVENAREKLVIDGYDFASYNRGEISMMRVMKELSYTEPTLLVSTYYKGVIATLSDGNIFTMHKEYGDYAYYLYIPEGLEVEEVSVGGDFELNTISNYEYGSTFDVYSITCFLVGKGTNIEMPITIKLSDGTEKKMSVYITKSY